MSVLSDTALNALKLNPPQKVKIKVSPTEGSEFYLTEEQIVQNSCTVDRYVVSGDKISYGTACAAELNFKIRNQKFTYNGTEFDPNNIKFEGAKVKVWCVVDTLPGNEKEIPMGVFTIDEQPRRLATISLTALDDMVKLDKPCSFNVLPSIVYVRSELQTETGVIVSTNFYNNVLRDINANYPKIANCTNPESQIPLASDTEEITWRQLMCWYAELEGGNLIINADGELDVLFFPDTSVITIDESMRYSSDMEENDITTTGVTVTLSDSTEVVVKKAGYTYNISDNKLITDTAEDYNSSDSTVGNMSAVLTSNNVFFTYRPFTANIKSLPNLWPMDGVIFKKDSNEHFSVLTHVTWTLNGAMAVESAGLNSTKNGYAKTRSLTSAEKAIIEHLAKKTGDKISDFEQQVIKLNEKVKDTGKGLFHTPVEDENGGYILYAHDMPTLEESTYITMTTTAGFVFTYGEGCWNDGNPIWLYGYTDYGDMVMNTIAARKISTELLTIGTPREVTEKDLILNGCFDDNFIGWNQSASAPFYSAEIVSSDGNNYIKLCPGHETANPHLDSEPIYVLPGKEYKIYYEAQCDMTLLKPRIQVDIYEASTNTLVYTENSISTSYADNFNDFVVGAGEFVSHSVYVNIPSNDEKYYVILRLCASRWSTSETMANGYFVRFDNIQLIGEAPTEYNNVYITEDEISVYNGKITIYSDSSGGSPVFSANDDGTLNIVGSLRTQGDAYDMLIMNAMTADKEISIDTQGIFQVEKGQLPTFNNIINNEISSIYFTNVEGNGTVTRGIKITTSDAIEFYTTSVDGLIWASCEKFKVSGNADITGDITLGNTIARSNGNHLVGIYPTYSADNIVLGDFNQAGHTVIRTSSASNGSVPSYDISMQFAENISLMFREYPEGEITIKVPDAVGYINWYMGNKKILQLCSDGQVKINALNSSTMVDIMTKINNSEVYLQNQIDTLTKTTQAAIDNLHNIIDLYH
ncbi:MAG: hypothetical protein E7536_09010 [Ruminococcaceae bacterium]|nr:hypothetical protein [Oscillospiraceae bacterium]